MKNYRASTLQSVINRKDLMIITIIIIVIIIIIIINICKPNYQVLVKHERVIQIIFFFSPSSYFNFYIVFTLFSKHTVFAPHFWGEITTLPVKAKL